jgi:hypothetical protein
MDQSYGEAAKPGAIQSTLNKEGELLCSNRKCNCPVTVARLNAAKAPAATVEAQQALRVKIVKDREVQEALAAYAKQLQAEYARIEALKDAVEKAAAKLKLRVIEEALTLKCPRCKAAFCNFSGCYALTCHCGAGFCGWCLADCGTDAHEHVASCPENGTGTRSVFSTKEAFDKHHRNKSARKCREMVARAELSSRAKELLRQGLEGPLREHNIRLDEVFPPAVPAVPAPPPPPQQRGLFGLW